MAGCYVTCHNLSCGSAESKVQDLDLAILTHSYVTGFEVLGNGNGTVESRYQYGGRCHGPQCTAHSSACRAAMETVGGGATHSMDDSS